MYREYWCQHKKAAKTKREQCQEYSGYWDNGVEWTLYLYKKRQKNAGKYVFIWIALNRSTNKVVDFGIGDRTKQTYLKLALRLEKRFKITYLCTDHYAEYVY